MCSAKAADGQGRSLAASRQHLRPAFLPGAAESRHGKRRRRCRPATRFAPGKCCEGCKLCLRTAVGADVWRMPNCARKDENRKVKKLLKKSRFCAKNPKSRKAAKAKLCKTRKVEKSKSHHTKGRKNNSWNTSEASWSTGKSRIKLRISSTGGTVPGLGAY